MGGMDAAGLDTLLCFDFDGVICDSADEALVCSWIAWQRLSPSLPDRVPRSLRPRFRELRPFIRTGEDFLLIQDLLARGVEVRDQADFDRRADETGPERMALYRRLVYRVREEMVRDEKAYWLGLHRLFPALAGWLPALARQPAFRILSTKKPRFIVEVLEHHGVRLPPERIMDAGTAPKLGIVSALLDREGFQRALFVEDQVGALAGNRDGRIDCRLAAWGYVRPEWLEPARLRAAGARALEAVEVGPLLRSLLPGLA